MPEQDAAVSMRVYNTLTSIWVCLDREDLLPGRARTAELHGPDRARLPPYYE